MMSVPWRSCLQLSHRRRFCHRRTAIGGGGGYRLAVPVDTSSLGRIALMRLVATHVALGVVCVSVCWAYRRAVQNK